MSKAPRSTPGPRDEARGAGWGGGGAITVLTNSFYPFQRDGWLGEESLDFLNLRWKRKSDRRIPIPESTSSGGLGVCVCVCVYVCVCVCVCFEEVVDGGWETNIEQVEMIWTWFILVTTCYAGGRLQYLNYIDNIYYNLENVRDQTLKDM